ncbi:hypothetical protein RQP46_004679 [Phenoliferia psychrophenolica]
MVSSTFEDDANTFWVQGVFPGHTMNKMRRLITENGGVMAPDYTDVNLKRCTTLTRTCVVRIWMLPLEWLIDSIEAGEMQPEEDYDVEFNAELQREERRQQLAAERKRNGGVSKFGKGGRKMAEAAKRHAAAIKEYEREEAARQRNGLAPSGLDAPKMPTIPPPKPKPTVVAEPPPPSKQSLAQSSLSFAADREEPDPWDEKEKRMKKKRPAPDAKPARTASKPSAPKPAASSSLPKGAVSSKVIISKPAAISSKIVGNGLVRTSSLLGDKPNGSNMLPRPASKPVSKPDAKKRRPVILESDGDSSDCFIVEDSADERPAYKKRA